MVERAVPQEPEWAELGAPHLARYLFAAEHAAGRRVLDAGSGAGYGAGLLKSAGATDVLGVDIDLGAVRRAEQQFGEPSVRFIDDDCQDLGKVTEKFDLICNFEAIEHFAKPERFLHRAAQLLAPGGCLMVSTPDRADSPPFVRGKPRNPFHEHEWYREEFRSLLAEHFTEIDFRIQVRVHALESRAKAVAALRQGFMWVNPLATLVWRKWPLMRKRDRAWRKIVGLAAPSISDFPVVPFALAPLYGVAAFHFAICRGPKTV